MKLQVQNLTGIQSILKTLPPIAAKELEAGLIREAGGIMNEAQTRVPVVTGRLRSSAFVRGGKRRGGEISCGYEAPYAIFVHEVPYTGRTTKGLPGAERNGQGYKWLEKAARFSLRGAKQRLVNAIRKAIRGKR